MAGYFSAGAVRSQRLFIDRRDAAGTPPILEGLLGHPILPEPYEPPPPGPTGQARPPYAMCSPGPMRTPIQPAGWQP